MRVKGSSERCRKRFNSRHAEHPQATWLWDRKSGAVGLLRVPPPDSRLGTHGPLAPQGEARAKTPHTPQITTGPLARRIHLQRPWQYRRHPPGNVPPMRGNVHAPYNRDSQPKGAACSSTAEMTAEGRSSHTRAAVDPLHKGRWNHQMAQKRGVAGKMPVVAKVCRLAKVGTESFQEPSVDKSRTGPSQSKLWRQTLGGSAMPLSSTDWQDRAPLPPLSLYDRTKWRMITFLGLNATRCGSCVDK